MLVKVPWQELDMESLCMELRKPTGGLPLDGFSHPFDAVLHAGLVLDPDARYLTLDQLHNTLGISLAVATTQVLTYISDIVGLIILISVPSLGVYYCQQLTLSVCHTPSNCFFLFVSRWNRAIFWPSVLHMALYKTLFSDF